MCRGGSRFGVLRWWRRRPQIGVIFIPSLSRGGGQGDGPPFTLWAGSTFALLSSDRRPLCAAEGGPLAAVGGAGAEGRGGGRAAAGGQCVVVLEAGDPGRFALRAAGTRRRGCYLSLGEGGLVECRRSRWALAAAGMFELEVREQSHAAAGAAERSCPGFGPPSGDSARRCSGRVRARVRCCAACGARLVGIALRAQRQCSGPFPAGAHDG